MIKRIKIYYVIGLVLCSISFSQDNVDVVTKVATAAANWLKLETGTRAIGMSGAYTAAGDDVSGIPYNPASVAFIDNQQAFLSQTKYIADISYSVLGYGRNMSGTDFLGLHIFALDSGPMDITTLDEPEGTGEQFKMTGICIRGTYARRLTDRLRIGFTGKFIREDIHTAYMQTVAFDVGSNFDTGNFGFLLGMISAVGFSVFSVSLRWKKETPKFTTVAVAGLICFLVSLIVIISKDLSLFSSSKNQSLFAVH